LVLDPEGSSQSDTLNPLTFDLSSLRALISGGEANTVKTCVKLTDLLRLYGAPTSFIRPGFGMTETCAGAIYALDCPAYDVAKNSEFACLGSCIPGIEIIVVRDDGTKAATNEVGMLEIRGPVVFNEYYNNRQATVASKHIPF
jgi:acyl-CoA synthetase (AMP-forming)/AMP-acid ligase II